MSRTLDEVNKLLSMLVPDPAFTQDKIDILVGALKECVEISSCIENAQPYRFPMCRSPCRECGGDFSHEGKLEDILEVARKALRETYNQ